MWAEGALKRMSEQERRFAWDRLLAEKPRFRKRWQPEIYEPCDYDVWLGRDKDEICVCIGTLYRKTDEGEGQWQAHVSPKLEPSWEAQTLGRFKSRTKAAKAMIEASLRHGTLARLKSLVVHPLELLAELEVE